MNPTIEELVQTLDATLDALQAKAKQTQGQYTRETCPLNFKDHHDEFAEILAGGGRWRWYCPFCETEYQD